MIKVGDNFRVFVNMNLTGLISAMGFDIKYDPLTVKYESVSKLINYNHFAINPVEVGRIAVGINHPDGIQSCNSKIMELTFKALKKGTTQLMFIPDKVLLNDVESTEEELVQEWHDENVTIEMTSSGILIMTFIIEL